jgi:hypothetical protein
MSARLLGSFVATLVLALAVAGRSAAQCGSSDGLDGGFSCQSGAFVSLQQGGFNQPALGICWKDCGLDTTKNYNAKWTALVPVPGGVPPGPCCGWFTTNLTLLQGSQLRWFGKLHCSYSRTWSEVASPKMYQVWRYLVNGDLQPAVPLAGPCALPPCAAPNGNKVRFTGYIDYAQDCSIPGGLTERAWMLTHACDAIDHVAGFPRGGTYHPDRFYTFLGPRLGFVVGAGSTLESGPSALEAIRSWDALALPARCQHEEPLIFGNFSPSASVCMCGIGPPLWYEAFFNAAGAFGATVNPFLGSDPFRSFPIGMWTNPSAYPGPEEVRWNTNHLDYVECTGVSRQEYYFGVTTAGGFAPFSLTPGVGPLPNIFVDQSNSVILPANVATRNRPYRSDHILNLNL